MEPLDRSADAQAPGCVDKQSQRLARVTRQYRSFLNGRLPQVHAENLADCVDQLLRRPETTWILSPSPAHAQSARPRGAGDRSSVAWRLPLTGILILAARRGNFSAKYSPGQAEINQALGGQAGRTLAWRSRQTPAGCRGLPTAFEQTIPVCMLTPATFQPSAGVEAADPASAQPVPSRAASLQHAQHREAQRSAR